MLITPKFATNIYNQVNLNNRMSAPARYGNLAPLSRDTVSFTSGKKDNDDPTDGVTWGVAKDIYNDAQPAQRYLNRQLDCILGDMIRPAHSKASLSNPIEIVRKRTKEPESIKEKSATRRLRSYDAVKKDMTDIVGARIVMADTSVKAVDAVIDRITDAVSRGRLKIIEIENYRPDPEMDRNGVITKSYDYASPLALMKLKKAASEQANTTIKKTDEDRESGYVGIHMLVQLPNGFTGEIQIMGSEVEKFKEVEDKCFKVKYNKKLKKKYAAVEKQLKPLANKDDEILQKEYNLYTRAAYLKQRQLEMDMANPRKHVKPNQEFLHIPDYLPEGLDFNNVAKTIKECDAKAVQDKSNDLTE